MTRRFGRGDRRSRKPRRRTRNQDGKKGDFGKKAKTHIASVHHIKFPFAQIKNCPPAHFEHQPHHPPSVPVAFHSPSAAQLLEPRFPVCSKYHPLPHQTRHPTLRARTLHLSIP